MVTICALLMAHIEFIAESSFFFIEADDTYLHCLQNGNKQAQTMQNPIKSPQTSVVILALGFVTFTPSCLAREMISIRFLDETAWEILVIVNLYSTLIILRDVLSSEGLVVHQEEVDIAGIVYEESLVARWHHVSSLLVRSKTNL